MKSYGVCKDSRFRPEVARLGGKQQFPFFVDEGARVTLQSSDAIVKHLFDTYGEHATPPLTYRLGRFLDGRRLFFFLPSLSRLLVTHGVLRVPSRWGAGARP